MDLVDVTKEFIIHMSFEKLHSIKYKYTIDNKKSILHNRVFYSETHTPKISEFEYGEAENIFYWSAESETYTNIVDLLKSVGLKLKSK